MIPAEHAEVVRAGIDSDSGDYGTQDLAHASLAALVADAEQARRERDEALRGNWKQEPSDEDGPGRQETYWLRNKLRSCVVHLRDVEDYYRVRGGTPNSFNLVRADRARSLYEQISDDFINGRMDKPTMRERAEAAETQAEQARREAERAEGVLDEIDCWIENYASCGMPASDALDGIGEELEKYRALAGSDNP